MVVRTVLVCIALTLSGSASGEVQPEHDSATLERASALEMSQAAVGRVIRDHGFLDPDRRPISLADFRGRPVVLSLVYTSCYHTCPLLTQRLARAVDVAQDALGEDSFTVLSIGFDSPVDTPERMGMFARQQGIVRNNWHVLSADTTTMQSLVPELGFVFRPSTKGFDHLAQVTVLDGNGRVYRQIYGEDFEVTALVEPLKELALGATSTRGPLPAWIDRVRLFCTIYDPASGRYRFDYSIVVAMVVGTLCLGAVAVFVLRAWRQSAPKRLIPTSRS